MLIGRHYVLRGFDERVEIADVSIFNVMRD